MSTADAELIASSLVFHKVGSAEALRNGEPIGAKVGDQAVAVFLVDDDIIATEGICPHATGPLHEGEVEGRVLTCPWHGWSFDLDSGVCVDDPCLHLKRFPVQVKGDDILVGL
ncbi:Rieske (2Fe-2S) protein [Pseudomonas saliphila]|uniref:Rieske (2Fe-2S) protein n=1 Tax=Pseudomonas saliphila TaxID=2586906 RepID=UPI0015B562D0|nr:Rieske (2Fe-2S) protein [Pseudomonas saliphila]